MASTVVVTWTIGLILLAFVPRRSIQLEMLNTTYTHWELQTEVRNHELYSFFAFEKIGTS